mmetsp:Transcript_19358/g.42360  ORF Transcript_19358/g.42360 Transcript_19358/m.42360 type:complete len:426 (-) Transcript_19358:745-2022(-)
MTSTVVKKGRMPPKLRWALQGMNFVDLLAVGFVEPLVTPLAKQHGASPLTASAIGSTYGFFQLLSSAPFGVLSDKYGRQFVYMFSCFGTAAAYFLLGLDSIMCVPLLFTSRAVAGISKHSGEATNALIADFTAVEKRSVEFGRMQTASTLGMMIAPTIGGYMYHAAGGRSMIPAAMSTMFLMVNAALAYYLLPGMRECIEMKHRRSLSDEALGDAVASASAKDTEKTGFVELLKRRGVVGALVLRLLMGLALVMFRQSLALVLTYRFDLQADFLGLAFSYQAMLYAVVYSLVIPLLTRWLPDDRLTTLGFSGMAVGCCFCAAAPNTLTFCLAVAPVVVSAAVVRTASTTLITHLVPPSEVGQMLGLADIVFSVSRMAAPTVCGVLMQWLGSAAPLLVCALAAGSAAVLSATITRHPEVHREKKDT